jgi:hypothetical protein
LIAAWSKKLNAQDKGIYWKNKNSINIFKNVDLNYDKIILINMTL